MCLKRFAATACPNCNGHLASIDNGLRECEQCGYLTKIGEGTMIDLQKFCSMDIERIMKPATIGYHTYATNGHICIRVPADEKFEPHITFPDVVGALPWDHSQLTDWVKPPSLGEIKPQKCTVCKGFGKVDTCPECDGEGEVCWDTKFNTYEDTCKTCGGDGIVPGDKERCDECFGTGESVQSIGIPWQRGAINARYVHLLKELPDVELSTQGDPDEVIRFRFQGGTGLLMPYYSR